MKNEFAGKLLETTIGVDLDEDNVEGGLGLDPGKEYYVYDFWNETLVGKFKGSGRLEQTLRPGEARMMSVHEVEPNPQFLSTNRHVMQGYVDMSMYPEWDAGKNELSGVSKVIGGETDRVVIALNGYEPLHVKSSPTAKIALNEDGTGLSVLSIEADQNREIKWTMRFK